MRIKFNTKFGGGGVREYIASVIVPSKKEDVLRCIAQLKEAVRDGQEHGDTLVTPDYFAGYPLVANEYSRHVQSIGAMLLDDIRYMGGPAGDSQARIVRSRIKRYAGLRLCRNSRQDISTGLYITCRSWSDELLSWIEIDADSVRVDTSHPLFDRVLFGNAKYTLRHEN